MFLSSLLDIVDHLGWLETYKYRSKVVGFGAWKIVPHQSFL